MLVSVRIAVVLAVCAAGACRNGVKPQATEQPLGESRGGARAPEAASTPSVVLRPDGRQVVFRVEVARTNEERSRGLMYREHLDADAGMLFIFEQPGPLSFWMKNCFIPLDMIFIGADRRVVGVVENAEPRTETSRRVPGDSQYVLEINGGLWSRLGLRPGAMVEFRNVPP